MCFLHFWRRSEIDTSVQLKVVGDLQLFEQPEDSHRLRILYLVSSSKGENASDLTFI